MINSPHHRPASAPGSAAPQSGFHLNPHTVWIAVRYWWKIATPVAILLAAAAAIAICYLNKPRYTAETWLLIKEKQDVILRSLELDSRKFIENQLEIIRSPRLLTPLTSNPDIVSIPEFAGEEDLVLAIARSLKIAPRGKSDIYVLSFASVSPEKAELLVKEVTKAYLDFRRQTESEKDTNIVSLLEEQRVARYKEMTELRQNVRELSMQITGIDPFRGNVGNVKDDASSQNDNQLSAMKTELVREGLELNYLAAEIKAEEEMQANAVFELSEADISKYVDQHPRYAILVAKRDRGQEKEAEFRKTGVNLEANPSYKQLVAELVATEQDMETTRQELVVQARESLERQFALARADRLGKMRREYASNQLKFKVLDDTFKHEMESVKKTAKQYTGDTLELEFRKAKLDQISIIHDEISARILAITTEQRAPNRVEIFKTASLPIRPDELLPWKKLLPGCAVAFALPFTLVVAWEHLFRRVSSRTQFESANEISVIGEVTSLPTRKRSLASADLSVSRDVLLYEESVDGLRTYLSLVESLHDMRVLAVTSAISREGKTSLASQLAVSIARATGEPTLLVDGDMRAPDIHWIFGTDLGPGLVEVLSGECTLDEAIETSFSDKLHILTAGKLTSNPHGLLGSGEFAALVEKLLTAYRHIIVDTPPVLPASEALVMARAADAAVVCVRRDFSRMDQVQDACRRMAGAGVNTIGAVINGIPVQQYASRYGSYGYYSVSK